MVATLMPTRYPFLVMTPSEVALGTIKSQLRRHEQDSRPSPPQPSNGTGLRGDSTFAPGTEDEDDLPDPLHGTTLRNPY